MESNNPIGERRPDPPWVQIAIGIGGNLGDSAAVCRQAQARLQAEGDLREARFSRLYRSEPVGYREQAWFINGAAVFATRLEPLEVLALTRRIENEFGRERRERWGPRTLDLDLLFYQNAIVNLPELTLPHPRLHERRFVLVPLADIAPDWRHPGLGATVAELLAALPETGQRVLPWNG